MITEFGHYALVTALFVALIQSTVPLVGASRGDVAWVSIAKPAALMQLVLVAIAFGALTHAFVVSDFSVLNVVKNSHSTKPMVYKVTGVWGNHEGSLLLWALILAVFGYALAFFGRRLPQFFLARVLAIQGMIGAGFLAFILFTSNPFLRLHPAPIDGEGMNPLLQDPGLILHPPFLYLGYVGFSVAFSFAIAALLEGRVDPAWARWVRPWTLAAWFFLTMGNALGSWWAYYELGWGGWWFWDPVENASFMPWLAGTALLHSVIVVEKRDALKVWTILLAIVTFSLSLLGTFLVRSGVLTSVHAFATDPTRGVFILMLILATVGGSLFLFALRAPALRQGGLFAPVSREGGLLMNNLLLSAAAGTVFLGTLYPLFLDVVGGGKVSVGPPFFNATFVPLMVPVIVVMAVGPLLTWKRGNLRQALRRLKFAFAATVAAAIATWWFQSDESPLTILGMSLATWLFAGTLTEYGLRIKLFRAPFSESLRRAGHHPRAAYGMTVSHLGFAVLIAGITGATAWQHEKIQTMAVGDSVELAGYEFTLNGVWDIEGQNYTATRGDIEVSLNGEKVARLFPEKRNYPVEKRPSTEAAIKTVGLSDLYAVIADPVDGGGWVIRLYHKALVPLLWLGMLVVAFGALVSLSDRRHRIGVPTRRNTPLEGSKAFVKGVGG